MKRYSLLTGTSQSSGYMPLGKSRGLDRFLTEIGSPDNKIIINMVSKLLSGIRKKDAYKTEKKNTSVPLAIRYASLHLAQADEKLSGLKPFCALSVNGFEERTEEDSGDARQSQYSFTTVIAREILRQAENGYCYLDQIFGTRFIRWTDVRGYRNNASQINFDALPQKVLPELCSSDRPVVIRTVEGIYYRKAVVIRLETESSFNERAWELLTQIYSLMQPVLATEIGFSTYSDTEDIRDLTEKTSIRIFIVPGEYIPETLPENCIFIDMNSREKITCEDPVLEECLLKWYMTPWRVRQESLEYLFGGENEYLNKEQFVRTSTTFFEAKKVFDNEIRSENNHGKFETLLQLREFRESLKICEIPCLAEVFNHMAPSWMKDGVRLNDLVGRAEARAFFASKNGQKMSEEDAKSYLEGKALCLSDTKPQFFKAICAVIDAETQEIRESLSAKLAEQKQEYEDTINEERAAHNAELALQKGSYENLIKEKDDIYSKKEAELTTTYQQMLDESERNAREELERQKKAAAEEKENACKELRNQVMLAKEAAEEQKDKTHSVQRKLDEEKEAHKRTKRKLEKAEDEGHKLSQDLDAAMEKNYRTGNWPGFLTRFHWIIPCIAMVLIGAILVGTAWGLTYFLKKDDAPEENTEQTELTESAEVTVSMEATEESVSTEPEQNVAHWYDPETIKGIRESVPEIQTVLTDNEIIRDFCPGEEVGIKVNGNEVLAVLSIDSGIKAEPDLENAVPSDNEADMEEEAESDLESTKPSDNEVDTAEETESASENAALSDSEADPAAASPSEGEKNYAVIIKSNAVNFKNLVITSSDDSYLALQYGDMILMAYGNDEMLTAAIKMFRELHALNNEPKLIGGYDEAEIIAVWFTGSKRFFIHKAMEKEAQWLEDFEEWSTEIVDGQYGNHTPTPVISITLTGSNYLAFDRKDIENSATDKSRMVPACDFYVITAAELQN